VALEFVPVFLAHESVVDFHDEQIRLHGGLNGVRDENSLRSALAAPENRYLYDSSATLAHLAAAYAFRISNNQPFIDGNKRTALQSAVAFLRLNGVVLRSSSETLYEWTMMTSSNVMTEERLAQAFDFDSVRLGGFVSFLIRTISAGTFGPVR
jgi:death-on-curing protein